MGNIGIEIDEFSSFDSLKKKIIYRKLLPEENRPMWSYRLGMFEPKIIKLNFRCVEKENEIFRGKKKQNQQIIMFTKHHLMTTTTTRKSRCC